MKESLKEIKEDINVPLRQVTLVFLKKGDEVLLAMKKRGFGAGKWNGSGGKKNDGETIKEAAIREVKEEIGVTIRSLKKAATVYFYFTEKQEWNEKCTVYLCNKWVGDPVESEEMKPQWFKINEIPYDQMWEADVYWISKIMGGKKITADILFDGNQKLVEKEIKEI